MGLDTVEFVLWAEKEFGMEMPDQEITNIYTVGEFAIYKANKLNEIQGAAFDWSDIFPKLLKVLHSDYGVERHNITFNSRFVQDLGLDEGAMGASLVFCHLTSKGKSKSCP